MSTESPGCVVEADLATSTTAKAAAELFGLQAPLVLEAEVLDDAAIFSVEIDLAAHERRLELGVGPEVDGRLLAIWEWPESRSTAPPPVVRLEAIMVRASRWRSGLQRARRWGAFAPAGLIADLYALTVAEECSLECQLREVGLVGRAGKGLELRVGMPPIRRSPGVRRTADRWIEEALYHELLHQRVLIYG